MMGPVANHGLGREQVKALILAAGLGTRLGSLTAAVPKCMLQVDGQPLIERLIRWLKGHGIDQIAVNLHYRPEVITDHLGDGSRLGVDLSYSYEATLLGTAGAVRPLASYFDGTFVVVYGDGYTDLDLSRLLRRHAERRQPGAAHLTMALFRVPNPSACGLVDLDASGRVLRFVEKPPPSEVFTDLASAGILVCERGVLGLISEQGPSDFGRDVLPLALQRGVPIYGEPLLPGEFLIDIGTPGAYEQARALAQGEGASGNGSRRAPRSAVSAARIS